LNPDSRNLFFFVQFQFWLRSNLFFFLPWRNIPSGPRPPHCRRFTWHSDTPHSVGLLGTSDQPDAETSTLQHITITRNRHSCPGRIRTNNPSKRAAADPRLRPQLIRKRNYTSITKRIIWKLLWTTEFQLVLRKVQVTCSRTYISIRLYGIKNVCGLRDPFRGLYS
jgi:hypothetical protein